MSAKLSPMHRVVYNIQVFLLKDKHQKVALSRKNKLVIWIWGTSSLEESSGLLTAQYLKALRPVQYGSSLGKGAWHLGCWACMSFFYWEPLPVPQPACCLRTQAEEHKALAVFALCPLKIDSQGLSFLIPKQEIMYISWNFLEFWILFQMFWMHLFLKIEL